MTNSYKIADAEVYNIEINGQTYEAQIRTDLKGSKSLVFPDSLRSKISHEIWEAVYFSGSMEEAVKQLKGLTGWK